MRRISIIFLKELKDTLRDRRTIFMMIVFPLILMYTIVNLMITMQLSQANKAQAKILNVALVTLGNAEDFRSMLLKHKDMKINENIDAEHIGEWISLLCLKKTSMPM